MALFQVQLKEDTEGIEVYCVLIVSDDATCVTFFEAQVLDSGFPSGLLNYTGCCSTLRYLYVGMSTFVVIPVSVCKKIIIKKTKIPLMHSLIHISLILFFLRILWLLSYTLSCQCVQADLLS